MNRFVNIKLLTAYTIKQLGANALANNAITTTKIADTSVTPNKIATSFAYERILSDGESGWNPDDASINFGIEDPLFDVAQGTVVVNLDGDSTAPTATCAVSNLVFQGFVVSCTSPPPDGAQLRYAVFNPSLQKGSRNTGEPSLALRPGPAE